MLFKEINQKYTELVAGFMAHGYYINSATMSGSQSNEIASVDLTDGKEIIRVCMEECDREIEENGRRHYGRIEGVRIFAGKVTDEYIRPNGTGRLGFTIWNDRLEVITEEYFYEVGTANRNGSKAYGTYEEGVAANIKVRERYLSRRDDDTKELTSQKAKEVALKWVKKQPRKKSTKLEHIQKVYRSNLYGRTSYHVVVKGEDMTIR